MQNKAKIIDKLHQSTYLDIGLWNLAFFSKVDLCQAHAWVRTPLDRILKIVFSCFILSWGELLSRWPLQCMFCWFYVVTYLHRLKRYFGLQFSKRPRLKNFENYIFVARKVWFIIWYAQILVAIFFSTFWISTNRESYST